MDWKPSPLAYIRWNLTKKGRVLSAADAVCISIPKCGRTWLKVFLKAYFSALENEEFAVKYRGQFDFRFTHDLQEHISRADLRQKLLGKHLLPKKVRYSKPVIMLARDPRDVVVSLYFHLTKRSKILDCPISEMLRHPAHGIRPIVWIMNTWMKEWEGNDKFRVFHYEDFHADTDKSFREVLNFLGFQDIDEEKFAEAIKMSSFDNMRKIESSGTADSHSMQPGDVNDEESYKVRKGKIGGYRDYLSKDDIAYLNQIIAELDPRLGYCQEIPE